MLTADKFDRAPLISITPVVVPYVAFPDSVVKNVDFPAPDGPITAVTRPCLMTTPKNTRVTIHEVPHSLTLHFHTHSTNPIDPSITLSNRGAAV